MGKYTDNVKLAMDETFRILLAIRKRSFLSSLRDSGFLVYPFPAMNRWAIIVSPYGTRIQRHQSDSPGASFLCRRFPDESFVICLNRMAVDMEQVQGVKCGCYGNLGGELRLGDVGRVGASGDTANVMRHTSCVIRYLFGVSGLMFEVLAEELKFLR